MSRPGRTAAAPADDFEEAAVGCDPASRPIGVGTGGCDRRWSLARSGRRPGRVECALRRRTVWCGFSTEHVAVEGRRPGSARNA